MGIFDFFKRPSPETLAQQAAHEKRLADIQSFLQNKGVPAATRTRLEQARAGILPWLATLTPAELLIARSHGLKPIAAISATCWLYYGSSWTEGHAEGWSRALDRLREEARAAGANAVLDVKMRTIPLQAEAGMDPLQAEASMDFTLIGTAVYVDGLPPSQEPIVATVPALEFVKLLEADVVPTGIAVGAHSEEIADWRGSARMVGMGNTESQQLSRLWETVRQRAHQQLRTHAASQGNGVLAHVNLSGMFERKNGTDDRSKFYLARHIVIATIVNARPGAMLPHGIKIVVDAHAGRTPLKNNTRHHQSYVSNEVEGEI